MFDQNTTKQMSNIYRNSKESLCDKIIAVVKNKINNFGDYSNLHGVGHVFSKKPIPFFKRLFWFIIVICCCLGAAGILRGALHLYSGDIISYSVDTNYLKFDTPFPAVTICEQPGSTDRIKPYLVSHGLPTSLLGFLKENVHWNLKYCKSCTNCKINQTCVENYIELVNNIRLNCSQILTDCWWKHKHFRCCDRFLPLQTEYGMCFVFNSRLTQNKSSIEIVSPKIGLPYLVFTSIQTVQIRIHAPEDIVAVSMENILGRVFTLPLVTDFEVILKAEQIISESALATLPVSMRGCLFSYEKPHDAKFWNFKEYSYNTCLLYCKAIAQIDTCNCTHHLMPKIGNFPSCDIAGSGCLYSSLRETLRDIKCNCPMGCEEIYYKTVNIHNYRHTESTPALMKRGTKATVKFANLPSLRVLRHAIRDALGLVVDIGGVGGVFFGASLLSVIEIFYLFFIRRER